MDSFRTDLVATIPSLQRFAIRLARTIDARDDLVQQTLMLALANEEKFQPGTDIGAWTRTIMFRRHMSNLRRHDTSKAVPIDDLADTFASDMPNQMDAMRRRDFWRAVDDLSDTMSTALIGALRGYTEKELAAHAGVALGTIKSRTSRAAASLRALITGEVASVPQRAVRP